MSATVEYLSNRASVVEIAEHLARCDTDFVPPLSARLKISDYAKKIMDNATRFEAWSNGTMVGLVAAYCNDQEQRIAYITSVSVMKEWMGKGIAARLMDQCVAHAKASGMQQISLHVAIDNAPAIKLYEKRGFVAGKANALFVRMNQYFKTGKEHGQQA